MTQISQFQNGIQYSADYAIILGIGAEYLLIVVHLSSAAFVHSYESARETQVAYLHLYGDWRMHSGVLPGWGKCFEPDARVLFHTLDKFGVFAKTREIKNMLLSAIQWRTRGEVVALPGRRVV
jgi:hypothetical protein